VSDIFYSIADEVFIQFPGYVRGVVLAYDVRNAESPIDLIEMLRAAETSVRDRLNKEEITLHPRISSWREAYRSFGAKPGKYRSSIEAMVRRVLGNNELPSINTLVDIGNILSLRYLVPMGGHAIDVVKKDQRIHYLYNFRSKYLFADANQEKIRSQNFSTSVMVYNLYDNF
jgi:DNA/RNA-binding domain of Phe-tRNA-synthetase-like protein